MGTRKKIGKLQVSDYGFPSPLCGREMGEGDRFKPNSELNFSELFSPPKTSGHSPYFFVS